jgi:hypothetical protein
LKARLLFPGTAFAIGITAFSLGYRFPRSIEALSNKVQHAVKVAPVPHQAPAVSTSSVLSRDNLQVEGFAKIGFAEMEELLTTASPEQREQWAQKLGALPDSPLKPIGLIAFYTAWVDLKPEEALRALRKLPDLIYRVNVFEALGSAVSTALLPQLMDVISELSDTERRMLLPGYLTSLAQTDPEAAARFIDSHPLLASGSDASALISAWAPDDIEAAAKWLETSQFFAESNALRLLINSWLAKDPAAARNYVLLHRDNPGIDQAATAVAGHLFNTSPAHASDFIRGFDIEHASRIVVNLVSTANDDQVPNLATWAFTLPSSVAEETLGFALARWHSIDPSQALEWIRAKPTTERDPLVLQLIHSYMAPASSDIVTLAYKIRDVQKRDEALSILVQSMAAETGDATEQIRALGLPPSQTKHLLELLPNTTE